MHQLHPDELAFLAAIHANPDEETPSLVYADWLDDHGDPRGSFIRRSIQDVELVDTAEYYRLLEPLFAPLPEGIRYSTLRYPGLLILVRYWCHPQYFRGDWIDASVSPVLGFHFEINVRPDDDLAPILSHPVMRRVHQLTLRVSPDASARQVRQLAACRRMPRIDLTVITPLQQNRGRSYRLLSPVCRSLKFIEQRAEHVLMLRE